MSQATARNDSTPLDFTLPNIGEGVYEVELIRWLVQPGDRFKNGQPLAEVMTDKATMEVPAPFSGTIVELTAKPGSVLKVGGVAFRYHREGTASAKQAEHTPSQIVTLDNGRATPPEKPPVQTDTILPVKAAPSVRRLARELGVDLSKILGTGPEGRILRADVTPEQPRRASSARSTADTLQPGTRVKLQGLRRRIAEHMVHAKRTIPHYSVIEECDVTALVDLRQSLRDRFTAAGVKLTYLAFAVKATAIALREFPLVNSSLDEQAGEIVLHEPCHIGIAVATPGGLLVPVLRDADQKDLPTIAREIEQLSDDARAGKSKLDHLRGGTFSITSVGNLGGLISTPVINHPEVGILGLGRIVKRPVYDENDNLRPAQMLYLSLSFDHRVVDGAVGVAFTNAILRELRTPAGLLLGKI